MAPLSSGQPCFSSSIELASLSQVIGLAVPPAAAVSAATMVILSGIATLARGAVVSLVVAASTLLRDLMILAYEGSSF